MADLTNNQHDRFDIAEGIMQNNGYILVQGEDRLSQITKGSLVDDFNLSRSTMINLWK
jgi:hypothetical protein